ncbi:MAG: hypothetical protein HYV28_00950, partial [Ignavibacteriales bacterium]|nr:hypothetical protein [Ignavibacteriales bacterium]
MYQYIKNTASGGTWEISGTACKQRTVETNYQYLVKKVLLLMMLMTAITNAQQVKQTSTTVSYGYTNKPLAAGSKMKATISVGQNFTKMKIANGTYSSAVGIWSFYLQPPLAPHVLPTQGDYPDRVDVNWSIDPLSAPADVDYFKVYKDNTLIATVSAALHTYKDLDVHPGNYYEYKVTGVNEFGESQAGIGVGFVNPSGTFTGRVTTKFQAPVNDVEITMTPNPGKAFVFNGLNNYADAGSNLNLSNTSFTIEFWLRREVAEEGTVFSQNLRDSSGLTPRDSQLVIGCTNGGNSFYASFNAASSAVFSDSVDGQWHHYAWVYNMESDSAIIYKDGISQIQYQAGGSFQGAGKMLFSYNYAIYFPMSIDEMRFWSTPKDSESVLRNMKRSVSSASAGLLCYWKFDEGKGTRFFDYASKKNTGNILGTVQFSD